MIAGQRLLPAQTDGGGGGQGAHLSIAVLIPCYNEERTIAKVVKDFQIALPSATIYVCDNASEDRTAAVAREQGAIVFVERLRGKGNAVRRLFADVDADIYVMVDGDDTYDAAMAPVLIAGLLDERLDMVSGARLQRDSRAFRPGHRLGNAILTKTVAQLFGKRFRDMLSGYRVMTRRFVKSFPAMASGFEIETELTVHALELRMAVIEIPTEYRDRGEGSASKLHTFRDGIRILKTIIMLLEEERPLRFFGACFAALATLSLALGIPVAIEFIETGLVPRVPTAILASAIMILAFLSLTIGMILDIVTRGRREMKRLRYLEIPALWASETRALTEVGEGPSRKSFRRSPRR